MKKVSSTTVTEKLFDLELIFKLKADIARFKKRREQTFGQNCSSQAA